MKFVRDVEDLVEFETSGRIVEVETTTVNDGVSRFREGESTVDDIERMRC